MFEWASNFRYNVAVVLGALCVAHEAAAGLVSWQEQVKLNDGRVVVVSQERRCVDPYPGRRIAGFNLPHCRVREAWLKVKLPETGNKEVVWHGKLMPQLLDVYKGSVYLVGSPPSCREHELYGRPEPWYVAFKYEDHQWNIIGIEDLPSEIYQSNLLLANVVHDGTKLLTIDDKNADVQSAKPPFKDYQKRVDPNFRSGCPGSSREAKQPTKYSQKPTADELAMAIDDADVDGVRELLNAGAPVKSRVRGFAPLARAAMTAASYPEGFQIIDLLLAAGADIEQVGPLTPLQVAAWNGPPEPVAYLLKKGANPNADEGGGTALYQATRRTTFLAAEVLIRGGANVNARTGDGVTPLHMAAVNGMESTVQLLLDRGADVNARDRRGTTPLGWAKGNGPPGVVGTRATAQTIELLIKNGATE